MINFTPLDWDTNFFGYPIAKLTLDNFNKYRLITTLNSLRKEGFRLVYWNIAPLSSESSQFITTIGGLLVDSRVTFIKKISKELTNKIERFDVIPYPAEEASPALIDLAIQSGLYSRFKVDPLFSNCEYERLYSYWISESVKKRLAWEVLVVMDRGEPLGMITLGKKSGRGEIGLLSVSGDKRRMGLGKTLVMAADLAFLGKNFSHVQVVTQRDNIAASSLYEDCGYVVENIEHVYHFWL